MAASAQTLPWPLGNILGQWNPNAWGNNNSSINTGGVVSSMQGSSLTLQNGVTVFLHQGTVINPTGTTLQPGMQVRVLGGPGGNNAINANEVDVVGYANNGLYGYGTPYGYNNGNPYPNGNSQWQQREWQREQWQREQAQREQWQREQAQRQQWQQNHQWQQSHQWQQQQASRYNGSNWQNDHRRSDDQRDRH
ncbi:MAG: hypothetical protein JO293_08990 [Candidatus Eremiobacteraeota bacterium]|nr:hypothetical protein [Candidatus Eremiobacteraeota bacterium]